MADDSRNGGGSGFGGNGLFSREAGKRLAKLNRKRLKDALTTADKLSGGAGAAQGRTSSSKADGRGELETLCPGKVADGPEGQCYLLEGPASRVVPTREAFDAEYRRTFLGGGTSVTLEELHETVRPFLKSPVDGIGYMDIETCGMAGMPVFLLGVLLWREDVLVVRQFLARDYSEERAMLARAWECLDELTTLVTFNGLSFDVPFIEARAAASGLGCRRLAADHVDLLHEARRRWKAVLPNCRLQTLERFICGRLRSGDIPGELIPEVYHEYVRTGNAGQMAAVVRHNALDVVTLAELAVTILQNRDGDWL